jgi:putative intracellular protease/amidase
LDKLGLLKGKRFTCYPGLESGIDGDFVNEPVVADGNFITSQAAGTSEAFAFAIAEKLVGKSKADLIRGKMFCK